jgi:hypothetical protein
MRVHFLAMGQLLVGAILALGLFSGSAMAGPWVKGQGNGYAKVGNVTFVSDYFYDEAGLAQSGDPFILRANTTYFYGEVGIFERLMMVGMVPYVFSTNQHLSGLNFHTFGFGDAMLGLQLGILEDAPFLVSARLETKLPLYEGAPTVRGLRTEVVEGYPRTSTFFPALGDGQVDLSGFLSVGGPIPFRGGFWGFEPGFRWRFGDITHAGVFMANGGFYLVPDVILMLVNAQGVITVPSDNPAEITVGKGYFSLGPAFMVFLGHGLAVELGADLVSPAFLDEASGEWQSLYGVNTAGGFQVLMGLSWTF